MSYFWKAFTRRKPIEKNEGGQSLLKRCLTTVDLTALGVGSTLGVGVYVITGTVAANSAGPSVVISFLIAAISSIFAGLCYAEFGALVPKAGSAYVYSYISVGELMAFVIGWNLILEYVIGTASVAKSYSNYLDSLLDNKIENFFLQYFKMPDTEWFGSYLDFFAFGITMLLTVMLMIGVKESTRFTTIFTALNFVVIVYCVIVGLFKVDFHNWNLPENSIPDDEHGTGGFFPFGFKGVVDGAATCFYSFVGFDAIATTGEEVLNPQKSLPISIILSLALVSLAYCSVAAVQTLLWPYWDQDQKAPLPYVFGKVGYPIAKYVITIGALAGLSTSLLGAMFPLPRVLYAMASDGLVFKFLSKISQRFKTPAIATILSGLFAAIMATIFNVKELADMMSIGTLLAYSLVAISVLILRYKKEEHQMSVQEVNGIEEIDRSVSPTQSLYNGSVLGRLFNCDRLPSPDSFSSRLSMMLIFVTCVFIFGINILMFIYESKMYDNSLPTGIWVVLGVLLLVIVFLIGWLALQPKAPSTASFQVPFVPLIPYLSVFTNTYLMSHLSDKTWYRFTGWMVVGFIIYFSYGIIKSVGYLTEDERSRLELNSSTNARDSDSSE